ncbi:viperin family antiviral radical SAM protein [Methanocalculus sp.]|uniref:viperin family antiviral radical SAM protein n=1 Tax=Methanocalculus sp. TaxID=2004547 RepID=UPI00262922E6|nr:viperin family antiviral radical SAM protein [Methanocalculus sp.]MDG6251404.1 viperin family antiviral radical SAM protein [Methanocalculus sp.]
MLPKAEAQRETASIRSANWHITSKCNYHCKFCFARNLKGDLRSLSVANEVLSHLWNLGITKINFVGGEPLMHPLIVEVVKMAKGLGFATSISTNGSLCTAEMISEFDGTLDWIGLSLDSVSDEIEKDLGRGNGNHLSHIIRISDLIRKSGIKLKINTTVTRKTYMEDMQQLIGQLCPDRWKAFQFLHVKGQNDQAVPDFAITPEEFGLFRSRHEGIMLQNGTRPVFESADDMVDSYLMINPEGNLFVNTGCKYQEIPLLGVTQKEISTIINPNKYRSRGGVYDWS